MKSVCLSSYVKKAESLNCKPEYRQDNTEDGNVFLKRIVKVSCITSATLWGEIRPILMQTTNEWNEYKHIVANDANWRQAAPWSTPTWRQLASAVVNVLNFIFYNILLCNISCSNRKAQIKKYGRVEAHKSY
jgi:hypothetical protein